MDRFCALRHISVCRSALQKQRLAADVPAGVLAALVDPSYVGGYPASFQAWTQGLWKNAQANLKTCVKAGVTLAAAQFWPPTLASYMRPPFATVKIAIPL